MGKTYSDMGETNKAIEYYEEAIKIAKKIEDKLGECAGYANMGKTYSDLGETNKATEFLKKSLAIGKSIEDPRIISFCEQKLKELEEPENNENSNNPPDPKNLLQTIVSKLKSKK